MQPEGKAFPSPQTAQVAVSLEKDFLCHILSIMEIAEFIIHISIDTLLVFIYKHAKSLWFSVEASLDYAAIFRSHSVTLSISPII